MVMFIMLKGAWAGGDVYNDRGAWAGDVYNAGGGMGWL